MSYVQEENSTYYKHSYIHNIIGANCTECFSDDLAAEVSVETIRLVHGEDGKCRQVEGAGSDHHCHKESPVHVALSSHVIVGSRATELVSKVSAKEDWHQSQTNDESYA